MLLTLLGGAISKPSTFLFRGLPLSHSNALQYYVKREKRKVNDVIFLSGCEARASNLGNKNMKIGIFTGVTSERSNNIFTAISPFTGKHEIIAYFEYFGHFHALNAPPETAKCNWAREKK